MPGPRVTNLGFPPFAAARWPQIPPAPLKGDTVDFLDLLARMIAAFVSAIRFLQAPSRATATTAAVTVGVLLAY